MATKIRLQRHGKKRYPFYHIVVADTRAKRDGRYIEKIGTYNPNTNPATIDMQFDRALHWVKTGAQPTDTARAILSYQGVMLKNHLDKGVAKGALSEADADKKFEAWLKDKTSKIEKKSDNLAKVKADERAKALAAEKEKNEARAAEIVAKNTPEVEEVEEETLPETETAVENETTDEAKVEETTVEAEAPAEEAPKAEVKEEE